jgi:hypothetical protein
MDTPIIPNLQSTYTNRPPWRELRLRAALERTEELMVRLLERPCPSCGRKPGEEVASGR